MRKKQLETRLVLLEKAFSAMLEENYHMTLRDLQEMVSGEGDSS